MTRLTHLLCTFLPLLCVSESYDALLKYGVDVCSFKTDACVIVSSDLEQAGRALLRVAEGIQHEESQDSYRIRRTTNYSQKSQN